MCTDRDNNIFRQYRYVGKDAAVHFLRTLFQLEREVKAKLKATEPIVMTSEQQLQHSKATKCYLCHEPFVEGSRNYSRCADHDHISGLYIGAAHSICNLHRSEIVKLVGFAHNFTGYDSHILMDAIVEMKLTEELDGIPLNTEKFKMLKIGNITFLDSAAFLSASLDQLVKNLKVSDHSFPIVSDWLRKEHPLCFEEELQAKKQLLLRKGVYPYEFMDSYGKVDYPLLPERSDFFSRLTGSSISEDDYRHAQEVWKEFDISSMKQYTELYVMADTVLLAEAVTSLRDAMHNEFDLDLAHYLSMPMMSKVS